MLSEKIRLYENREDITLTSYVLDDSTEMLKGKRHGAVLIDTDKIAICGFSAGGYNCAMYSVYWNQPLITDFFNKDAAFLKPAAAILADSLAQKRIPFEMHIFEEGAHGLSTATQSSAGSTEQIDMDAAKWILLCGSWLKRRFALDIS